MLMSRWELSIALRYLLTKHKDGFISVINLFSIIGIALGVATLIIVMSVMGGYEEELMSKILGFRGHLLVSVSGENTLGVRAATAIEEINPALSAIPGVSLVSRIVERQGIVSAAGQMTGAIIKGVQPEYIWRNPAIREALRAAPPQGTLDGAIIGVELARSLGIRPGGTVKIISPTANHTVMGAIPRMTTIRVVGTLDLGVYDYNAGLVLVPLQVAEALFKPHPPSLEIALSSASSSAQQVAAIRAKIEAIADAAATSTQVNFQITDWRQSNQALVQALEVEQSVMFLILSLIVMIAAFNIVSSLVILVKDKSRSIAILRAMGASRASIIRIFICCGSAIGVVGTGLGVILGIAFTTNINRLKQMLETISGTKIFNPMVYFLTSLPANVVWEEVAGIAAMALGFSFLATIYPSCKIAYIQPARALRYE